MYGLVLVLHRSDGEPFLESAAELAYIFQIYPGVGLSTTFTCRWLFAACRSDTLNEVREGALDG